MVRDAQLRKVLSKLAAAKLSTAGAEDGCVKWHLDDMFQVQRLSLPADLLAEVQAAAGEGAQLSPGKLSTAWAQASKDTLTTSLLKCCYQVPVEMVEKLARDPQAAVSSADLGPGAAAAVSSQAGTAAVEAASAPTPTQPTKTERDLLSVRGELEDLRAQYNDLMRQAMVHSEREERLKQHLEAEREGATALQRDLADARRAAEALREQLTAKEVDGAGSDSPQPDDGTIRKRAGEVEAKPDHAEAAVAPADEGGFPLWQVVLLAVIMFLAGRLV